jgi:hypothetical protein
MSFYMWLIRELKAKEHLAMFLGLSPVAEKLVGSGIGRRLIRVGIQGL